MVMEFEIDTEHKLFERLANDPPQWWKNLIADPDIYIDIRKDNYINVYCNGGSIMKLEGADEYKATMHFEYIPLKKEKNYIKFNFENGNISLPDNIIPMPLNNFTSTPLDEEDKDRVFALDAIKKRIKKSYPNKSEKGLQGKYITSNHMKESSDGFFIDSEFQFHLGKKEMGRVDLVWVDLKKKKLIFVELKTMGDERLYLENSHEPESIDVQLEKYQNFAEQYSKELIIYYDKIFKIKNNLGILPSFVNETSLLNYKLETKPILLVGDCTQYWIDGKDKNNKNAENVGNAVKVNDRVKNIAHSCIYQGKSTFTFKIPEKSSGNIYCF